MFNAPDYELTYERTRERLVMTSIECTKNLNVLSYCRLRDSQSWAPIGEFATPNHSYTTALLRGIQSMLHLAILYHRFAETHDLRL
jgi:hypothetical protein